MGEVGNMIVRQIEWICAECLLVALEKEKEQQGEREARPQEHSLLPPCPLRKTVRHIVHTHECLISVTRESQAATHTLAGALHTRAPPSCFLASIIPSRPPSPPPSLLSLPPFLPWPLSCSRQTSASSPASPWLLLGAWVVVAMVLWQWCSAEGMEGEG